MITPDSQLPPPPQIAPMVDRSGLVTKPWLMWMQKLYQNRLGGPVDTSNSVSPLTSMLGAGQNQFPNNKRFGTSTDYTTFEQGTGFLATAGDATYWRDLDFPIIIRTTGANIPTLEIVNGTLTLPQWQVSDFNQCESQEFVHEWMEGSPVYWHVHLTTNGLDTTNRYVRFEVEYGYVTPGGAWVFPTTLNSGDLLIPANTATKSMLILSLGSFTPTGVKIGGHCVARLKRIASTGTAPTNNPWIAMLQLHIQCDTLGSRQIASK